jgi:hypothetical protein
VVLISESHGNLNWSTPYRGKPNTYDMYSSRASPRMPLVRFLWVVPIRGNLSHDSRELDGSYCCWEKGLPTQSLACRLTDPQVCHPIFSPNITIEVVMKVKHLLTNRLHQFIEPISPACDQYIQYLLTGAKPLVINRYRQGLQSWRCQLSTSLSLPFPTDDPPLST